LHRDAEAGPHLLAGHLVGDLPPMRFLGRVAHGHRGMLGERVDAGTLPESLLAVLDDLGLLVRGGCPTQVTALISQHQPGAVHPQQRLGRADELLHRPRQVCSASRSASELRFRARAAGSIGIPISFTGSGRRGSVWPRRTAFVYQRTLAVYDMAASTQLNPRQLGVLRGARRLQAVRQGLVAAGRPSPYQTAPQPGPDLAPTWVSDELSVAELPSGQVLDRAVLLVVRGPGHLRKLSQL
jgi:hypothetical protein